MTPPLSALHLPVIPCERPGIVSARPDLPAAAPAESSDSPPRKLAFPARGSELGSTSGRDARGDRVQKWTSYLLLVAILGLGLSASDLPAAQFAKSWSASASASPTITTEAIQVSARQPAADQKRPHFLVILVDDLGYGDLSCYGATDLQSPHLDQLATEGLRWTRFYASSSVCSPTRASLLSGRYPEEVGVPGVIRTHPQNSWGKLAASAKLLPQTLADAGYHTAMVGKWHLGLTPDDHPQTRGFAHFRGFLGDMMDDYYNHRRHGFNYMRDGRETIEPKGHATDLFTDWACEYLRSRSGENEPFFLYLAYNAPHTPIQPPAEWVQKIREREPDMEPRRVRLVALIEHMDAGIGRVLACLEEEGLAADTCVIFTSDNGGQLGVGASNGDLRDGKQSMYEGGLRVPCIVRWPRRVPATSTTEALGSMIDLFPTVTDLAGAAAGEELDGVSLRPVFRDPHHELPARPLFFHRREGGLRYGGMIIHAVQQWPWKLLKNSPYEPYELYRLDQDPLETTNLIEEAPRKYRELSARLQRQLQRGGTVPWQPTPLLDAPYQE